MSSKRDEFSRACQGKGKQFQNTDGTSWLGILVSLGGFTSDPALKLESVEMV